MFECAANGSESLMISWIRNDETTHILDSHFYISNDTRKSVLEVNNATVDDSGIYKCIATNADNETVVSEPAELLSKTVNKVVHNIIATISLHVYSSTINEYTS